MTVVEILSLVAAVLAAFSLEAAVEGEADYWEGAGEVREFSGQDNDEGHPREEQEEVWVVPAWLYMAGATPLLWVSINATNCTDGVDGLSASLTSMAILFLGG